MAEAEMISLLPKVDAMIINNRCGCGFFYPAKPPHEWTREESQSVADHQEIHLREQLASRGNSRQGSRMMWRELERELVDWFIRQGYEVKHPAWQSDLHAGDYLVDHGNNPINLSRLARDLDKVAERL